MPEFKPGARLSKKPPLNEQELYQIDAYWRAANYLTACQLYLLDNPLLERPLRKSDLKQTIVGHWGTCPGQNFIYTHLDRVIKRSDLDMIYLSGPGHGGNAMVAQDWLDGSYTEVYPNITRDKDGMQKLFKRFSFPGGIPSHVAPETPGSIHEGGELGYSLAHAFGAVADNPDLIAACVVGDGEAQEGEIWEAANTAHKYGLDNLIVFVDNNNLQLDGTCDDIMPNGDLGEKFRAFGWEVLELDGHSMEEITASIDKCYASQNGKPKCLYAHTVKGKGVSFMENQCGWHGVAPNDEQYKQAMAELEAQLIH